MNVQRIYILFFGSIAIILLYMLLDSVSKDVRGIGHTNLRVQFLVTDAVTETPVSSAHIRVDEMEFPGTRRERSKREFNSTTDEEGTTVFVARECMFTYSGNLFSGKYSMRPPDWKFHISAKGYSPLKSKLMLSEDWSLYKNIQGIPSSSLLTIPVELRKTEE